MQGMTSAPGVGCIDVTEGSIPPAPFIVGTGRCGTTLLRRILNAHPDLAIPAETHFIPTVQLACAAAADPAQTFLTSRIENPGWHRIPVDDDALREQVAALDPFTYGSALRAFYSLYARQYDKPRWGDKTPAYHACMGLIERHLPEARFIHVIRDGRDVALSAIPMLSRKKSLVAAGKRADPVSATRWWANRLLKARAESRRVAFYLEVRYEDLVHEPEQNVRRICTFLDLPWHPAMLQFHETGADARSPDGDYQLTHGMRPIDTTRVARWRTELTPAEIGQIDQQVGPLLRQLGYE